MKGIFGIYCGLLLAFPAQASGAAATAWVKRVAAWKFKGALTQARWSAYGTLVVFSTAAKKKATIQVCVVKKRKCHKWKESKFGFFPTFGPVGTVLAGPAKDPPAPKRKNKKKKYTKKALKKQLAALRKKRHGIFLFSGKKGSFLFPGWRPSYSHLARRMAFNYRGLLYLWNPLPKRKKKSLLLLTRGNTPLWSPDGRALAFLRKPFQLRANKAPKGGGIRIVDMLFRAAVLTTSGGEMSWAPDGKSIVYVGPATGSVKHALYLLTLKKKKPKPKRLLLGARHPHCPPRKLNRLKHLVAYQDKRGVWLFHLKTQKKKLIAAKATHPRWSAQGLLMVSFAKSIALLKPKAGLLRFLRTR